MISGSIVALVTPMKDGGEIDFEALRGLVDWHVAEGTDALVAVGTTGESATLDVDEHVEVIRRVVEYARGRVPVIAGTGANSTTEAIELTRAGKAAGAQACLMVTPYYNKPPQEGLYRHYRKVAETVEVPIILYNVPGRTGCDLQPATVKRLAEVRPTAPSAASRTCSRSACRSASRCFRATTPPPASRSCSAARGTSRSPPTSRRASCTRCAQPRWPATASARSRSMPSCSRCTSTCSSSPTPSP
jgi:4-hydroxy-tetrahydrodipicolinate synthase